MDDPKTMAARDSFNAALTQLAMTDDQKLREHTGRWLLLYIEQGNPVPADTDTQLIKKQLLSLEAAGWPKPTKTGKPRKTRSDKGKPKAKKADA